MLKFVHCVSVHTFLATSVADDAVDVEKIDEESYLIAAPARDMPQIDTQGLTLMNVVLYVLGTRLTSGLCVAARVSEALVQRSTPCRAKNKGHQ